jgi:hypothetical protein
MNYDTNDEIKQVYEAIQEKFPLNNLLKKVTIQQLIKSDARDSMKEDYFKNICSNFQDTVFELCHNYTEGMPSYQRMDP